MPLAEISSLDHSSTSLLRKIESKPEDVPDKYAEDRVIRFGAIGKPCGNNRSARLPEAPEMPTVEPGQLWLVELPPEADLSPLERRALTTPNVLIYDRSLAEAVAAILPFGSYAEPSASVDPLPGRGLERSIRFALDGWSVVRLIDPTDLPRQKRAEQIRHLTERLLAAKVPGNLPVSLFASEDAGTLRKIEASLGTLGAAIDHCDVKNRLTIVFTAVADRAAPIFSVASSNGLAG